MLFGFMKKKQALSPEEIRKKREEEEKKREDEIKEMIHEAAQEYIYIHGDKRVLCGGNLISFIHPHYADPNKEAVLNKLADNLTEDKTIDHEAQWVWSTKYLLGFDDDPENCEMAGHRAYNAARAGIVPALIYCLDYYKNQGNEKAAVSCLEQIAKKEEETAHVILLEWLNEGFHCEEDSAAIAELVDYAKSGQNEKARSRARWYLDIIGIEYK